jgi:ABC-type polysaccharide/polyol phosphate export permease
MFDTLRVLVGRELKFRYKGSFLGVSWGVLTWLGYVVVLQILWTYVLKNPRKDFAVFMYSGLLPFAWFSSSLEVSASTLIANRDLLRLPYFSRPLIPGVVAITGFILYLLGLPVLFGMMLFNGLPLKASLVALPVIWLVEGLLVLGFSILIAAVGVLIRDVAHLLSVILHFWFFLTPIFYGIEQVPQAFRFWFFMNPLTPLVQAHRDVTFYGVLPDWMGLAYVALVSCGLVAFSLLLFRGLEDAFIDAA